MAALGAVAIAQGALVEEFGFQIKDVKPDGRYTLVFNSSNFDLSGGVGPLLTGDYIRFPKGASVRRQFINPRYYCNLKSSSIWCVGGHQNAAHFNHLLNLTLRGKTPPRSAKDVVAVCRFAHIGGGTALVDSRP